MATIINSTPSVAYHYPITESEAVKRSVVKSLVTGQIAGLVSAVVLMLLFALNGVNPLYPLQVIGSLVLGQTYLQDINAAAVIMGLVVHQGVFAVILGLVFGAVASSTPVTTYMKAASIGLGLGVVAMILPTLLFPAFTVPVHGADIWNSEIPMALSWITFLVFGVSFGVYPWVAQKIQAADIRNASTPSRLEVRKI